MVSLTRQLYYYIITGVETICLWLFVLSYFKFLNINFEIQKLNNLAQNFKVQEILNNILPNIEGEFEVIVLFMLLLILTWATVKKLRYSHSTKVKQLKNNLNLLMSYSSKFKKILLTSIIIFNRILPVFIVSFILFYLMHNNNILLLIQTNHQEFMLVSLYLTFIFVSAQNKLLLFLRRIFIELKPYYNPDPTTYWHWFIKRIFAYIIIGGVLFFSSRFILLNLGLLDNSNLNSNSARYMLSALVQSEAAILAIVITLSIVAVQQTASSYSPRVIDIFKKNPDFWILTLSYIIAIIYGLGVLGQIKGGDKEIISSDYIFQIEMSYFLGIFVLFSLIPYILSTFNLLKPYGIIKILSEKITKQNLLLNVGEKPNEDFKSKKDNSFEFVMYLILHLLKKDGNTVADLDNDPIQPIVDIINRSLINYDYETARKGIESIERRIYNIFENENFKRKQYQGILDSTIDHVVNIAKVASATGVNEDFVLKIIAIIHYIGDLSLKHEVYLTTLKVTKSICEIGKFELQFKKYDIIEKGTIDSSTFNKIILQSLNLKNIYESSNEYVEYIFELETSLIEVIDSLKDVGKIAAKQKIDSITIKIVEILIEIEKVAAERDDNPGFIYSIMKTIANKADESLGEIRIVAKEQNLESVLQTFKKEYDEELINPESTHDLSIQSLLSFGKGEHDKTIILCNKVLKRNPENNRAWAYKGSACFCIGEFQEALIACDEAIKMKNDDSLSWTTKTRSLFSLKRYNEALEALDKLLDLEPENWAAWCLKGRSLKNLGYEKEALDAFDKAIQGKPDNSYCWIWKGDFLFSKLRFNDAIKTFDDGLKNNPDDVLLLEQKAYLLDVINEYEKAFEVYGKLIKINPKSTNILWMTGNILFNLNRFDEALDIYDNLLDINPDHFETYVNRGDILYKLERFDESMISYDKAIKLKPDYDRAWYNKSLLLFELGRNDEAFEAYNKIDPFYDKELFKHTLYQRARDYCSRINKNSALSCLQCAISFDKSFKERAKKDDLFKGLWGDEDFKIIVEH